MALRTLREQSACERHARNPSLLSAVGVSEHPICPQEWVYVGVSRVYLLMHEFLCFPCVSSQAGDAL